ncbi:hypothetical protein [Micromonospora sp. NPDC005652]|uniref:hypothetical protein n=1 Tax=Micromonospora sp. NPDC005652 TaxID=3157046 RepID=UPI0033F50223
MTATLTLTSELEAAQLLSRLRIAAERDELCQGCRSASLQECQAAAETCCERCDHSIPATTVSNLVRAIEALLDKARSEVTT